MRYTKIFESTIKQLVATTPERSRFLESHINELIQPDKANESAIRLESVITDSEFHTQQSSDQATTLLEAEITYIALLIYIVYEQFNIEYIQSCQALFIAITKHKGLEKINSADDADRYHLKSEFPYLVNDIEQSDTHINNVTNEPHSIFSGYNKLDSLLRSISSLLRRRKKSTGNVASFNTPEFDIYKAFGKLIETLFDYGEIEIAFMALHGKHTIVPYPQAVEVINRFASIKASRIVPWFRKHLQLLHQLVRQFQIHDIEHITKTSLFSNMDYPLVPWREKILSFHDLKDINQWIEISGLELLQEAQGRGKGIILLNSHMSIGKVAVLLLNSMGFEINSLESKNRLKNFGIQSSRYGKVLEMGEKAEFPLRELYLVKNILEHGGIVNMAGDGLQGNKSMTARFLGRAWKFRTGYADLAIISDAVVLPLSGSIDTSGKITIEINQALETGDKTMIHEERVTLMTQQYSTMLEREWQQNPGNIEWEQLRYYFTLPTIKN